PDQSHAVPYPPANGRFPSRLLGIDARPDHAYLRGCRDRWFLSTQLAPGARSRRSDRTDGEQHRGPDVEGAAVSRIAAAREGKAARRMPAPVSIRARLRKVHVTCGWDPFTVKRGRLVLCPGGPRVHVRPWHP